MASDGGGVERSHPRKEVGIPKPSCPGHRFQGTAEEPALYNVEWEAGKASQTHAHTHTRETVNSKYSKGEMHGAM